MMALWSGIPSSLRKVGRPCGHAELGTNCEKECAFGCAPQFLSHSAASHVWAPYAGSHVLPQYLRTRPSHTKNWSSTFADGASSIRRARRVFRVMLCSRIGGGIHPPVSWSIATITQRFRPLFSVPLLSNPHLVLNGEVSTFNDSRIDLRRFTLPNSEI